MPDTNIPVDYAQQAVALDFVVAFQKSSTQTKVSFASKVAMWVLYGRDGYDAIAINADNVFGIPVSADVLRRYIALIKTPAPSAAIGAFMKRMNANPALKKQFLAASGNYDAMTKVAMANGLVVTALDLQHYLTPWQVFVDLLRGLLQRGVITETQFEDHAGFPSNDGSLSGFGQDTDLSLMQASLSAAGWASRLTPVSDFSMSIGTLIFPSTAIVVGGMEGQRYSFKELGNMFAQGFSDALEATAQQLEDFHDTMSSIF